MSTDASASPKWTCERCTWINEDSELACAMCYITRSDAKDFPVQWEWQPNPDQWIPYDKLASAEIEEAYQSGAKRVTLTKGYFSQVTDVYILYMNHTTRRFEQMNSTSAKRRRVRRLADDDNSILIPIPHASIDSEHNVCSICLEVLKSDEGPESSVHLPACNPGHYFHRTCIAQVIKLRDRCPLCAKAIAY